MTSERGMTVIKPQLAIVEADRPGASPVPVALSDIEAAAARITGKIVRTPLVASPSLSRLCGQSVHLKLETRQPIGAFKLRGAMNAVLALNEDQRRRGLVTASTGNHGRAVAYT